MLHMLVNTHNPESCAFRSPEDGAALSDPFDDFLDRIASRYDIEVQGTWVNRLAHEIFVLVEAPNSHVIEDAMLEAQLVGRTHTRVLSVVPTQSFEVNTGD